MGARDPIIISMGAYVFLCEQRFLTKAHWTFAIPAERKEYLSRLDTVCEGY